MSNTLQVLNKIDNELNSFAWEVGIDMLGTMNKADAIFLSGSLDAIHCMKEYVGYLIKEERNKKWVK